MKKIFLIFCGMLLVLGLCHSVQADLQQPKILAVELYADWCAICKRIEPNYQRIQEQFAGQGVLFLRFDRTDQAAEEQSRLLAASLGIERAYQLHEGTGRVLLIDPQSKVVVGQLTKAHSYADMEKILNLVLSGEVVDNVYEHSSADISGDSP